MSGTKKTRTTNPASPSLPERLRVTAPLVLGEVDPSATPGFGGGKAEGVAALAEAGPALSEQQERLFAQGRTGGDRSVLLVLQGMDTAGKGGITRHVLGAVDPQGVRITGFGVPTPTERAHDFLWRVRPHVPPPGYIGVFDRSHYEDVVAARVRRTVRPATWQRRYDAINRFEQHLVDGGVVVVKVFLHISAAEQKARLAERLERPDKHWKYRPGDVDDRLLWDAFRVAYDDALSRCSTEAAPWYVVPADRKWYARWAVQQLLAHHLDTLDLAWPPAAFDPEAEAVRLAAT